MRGLRRCACRRGARSVCVSSTPLRRKCENSINDIGCSFNRDCDTAMNGERCSVCGQVHEYDNPILMDEERLICIDCLFEIEEEDE